MFLFFRFVGISWLKERLGTKKRKRQEKGFVEETVWTVRKLAWGVWGGLERGEGIRKPNHNESFAESTSTWCGKHSVMLCFVSFIISPLYQLIYFIFPDFGLRLRGFIILVCFLLFLTSPTQYIKGERLMVKPWCCAQMVHNDILSVYVCCMYTSYFQFVSQRCENTSLCTHRPLERMSFKKVRVCLKQLVLRK